MLSENPEKRNKTTVRLLSSAVNQARAMKLLIRFVRDQFAVNQQDIRAQDLSVNFSKIEVQIGALISQGLFISEHINPILVSAKPGLSSYQD